MSTATETQTPVTRGPPSAAGPISAAGPAGAANRYVCWISGGVANVLVFALLAGVLYVGHQTGWKMPKFSELFGAPPETAEDWCAEHLVPESVCVECNDELLPRPKVFGFC